MAASPNIVSHGDAMIFTQSEATAAERTWCFYLSNTADGTPATGKTIATTDFKISKNGAAFGNAAGTVTEMSLGWYKMVFATADLDTVGALACELSGEAGVDTLHVTHQVAVFDINAATQAVTIAAGGIAAASFASGAIDATAIAANAIGSSELASTAVTEIQTGLATSAEVLSVSRGLRNITKVLGTLDADGSTAGYSMQGALQAVVTLAGTWDGATVTVEYCPDPTADSPVWLAVEAGSTSNATVTVSGPVNAIRCTMSNDGASSEVVCTAEISYARG